MHNLDTFRLVGGVVLAVGMAPGHAQSESLRSGPYPDKPIRWVTGGGPDAMARILGQKFATFLKSELEKWAHMAKATGARAE